MLVLETNHELDLSSTILQSCVRIGGGNNLPKQSIKNKFPQPLSESLCTPLIKMVNKIHRQNFLVHYNRKYKTLSDYSGKWY